jgi:hypothetical protein
MIKYHDQVDQGSDEWLAMRCGLLTASEMKLIMTPTLKKADNDKSRAHVFEIAAQRISQYTEPSYISDDMLRGFEGEIEARNLYSKHYAECNETGFVTNDDLGFTIGYSPDGLIGDYGLIEVKTRRQKYQIQTIAANEVPTEYMLQIQTGLLVTGREWCDFISYSGGLHMFVRRVFPDPVMIDAIKNAAAAFEDKVAEIVDQYNNNSAHFIMTERRIEEEMTL